MSLAPLTVTRDLVHYRKLPPRQTALFTVVSSFFSLLSSTSHPSASSVRTAFLPALTGTDARPNPQLLARADEQLIQLFSSPPAVVLLQTVPSAEQIENAWRSEGERMSETVFVSFPLHVELERAKGEDEREEVANLSMLVIATLAYELAQWISVKLRGYRSFDFSDTASLRTMTTGVSVSSLHSTGSGGPLVPHRNNSDVGIRAVMALLGCDYELLTYAIGSRQLVKRRYPTRRSPVLTPPVVYFLIADTPAILDATQWPATFAGMVPPDKGEDSMYAVTSVLTPAGVAKMHGECLLVEGAGSSAAGSSVHIALREDEDEKVVDPVYRNL
ncbi:hypothetical protein JCM8547_001521 [Rhodosporidiobolus lusitaniae]